ncbi:MAG: cytochrome c [Blastocatellia bacterium]|nr:cytochrome c [Blastocatellia bacterium]
MLSRNREQGKARNAVRLLKLSCLCVLLALAVGCRQQMADQPRFQPLQKSTFFEDGASSRPLVAGTVARGMLHEDRHLYEGKIGELFAPDFPEPVTKETLQRGKDRYQIYCSMCHGYSGHADGMVVQRGFSPPPSFHDEATRKKPVGYYFSVISNGFGAMGSYSAAIPVRDRWAIVAYIRALQLSQSAKAEDIPAEERNKPAEGAKHDAGGAHK